NAYECDPDAVYLMGFSQGAMMSLAVALTYPGSAAGGGGVGGGMVQQTPAVSAGKGALIGLPVFCGHGARDTLLPINHGREARAMLSELPVELTYREYDMGHEISYDSLKDVTGWLKERLDHSSAVIIN